MSDKLCPDCGHPVSEHYSNKIDGFEYGGCIPCSCSRTPADQPEKHCTGCPNPSDNYNCLTKEDCPEQPTPTMPLIKPLVLYPPDIFEAFAVFTRKQRDADMTWLPAHDSAIASKAVKEFAEKVCKYLITKCTFINDKAEQHHIAHIRAMAEGKE